MQIEIRGKDLEITPSLDLYVNEKFGRLGKLLERFDHEGGVVVRVVIERTTHHHHKGPVYGLHATLDLPGSVLRAEELREDAHEAVDCASEELERQIEKYRAQHLPHAA